MLAVLLVCLPAAAKAQPKPACTGAAGIEDFIDGAIRSQMQTLSIPGVAVAVILPGRAPILRTYGVGSDARGAPVALDPDRSVMPIASISKTFIAVALMRAVEQGKLSLDDPANKYLDFKLATYPGARPITLRDLARHEAGFEERWLATGAGGTKPDPRPWGRILAQTAPQLIAPPGAYASYSNYGAALLAYIVERATGVSYDTYLTREVLLPLGMTSTGLSDPLPPALAAREIGGWVVSGGVIRPEERFSNIRSAPAGRIRSSLPDMVRYMRMLMDGGIAQDGSRFLSPASIATLLTPSKRLAPGMPTVATIFAEKDIGRMRFVGHGGDGDSRHTDMLLAPAQGFGIFIDYPSAPGAQTRDQFARTLVWKLFPEAQAPLLALPNGALRNLAAYSGAYRHYRWAQTSIERLLQLTSEFAVKDSGKGTLIITGRLGVGEYVPTADPNLFRNRTTGEAAYFRKTKDGGMLLNQGSYPFVTAYKLDEVDTQAFTSTAYWTFVLGLTAIGLTILAWAVGLARSRAWVPAAAHAVLGATLATCGIALYRFLGAAAAISEPELQLGVPWAAYVYLVIPVVAAVLVAAFVVGWIAKPFRARRFAVDTTAFAGVLLFVGFALFLAHWHAFGWWFPVSGATAA
jgi:CubicO group peptidase (beta-lactamase class C family)